MLTQSTRTVGLIERIVANMALISDSNAGVLSQTTAPEIEQLLVPSCTTTSSDAWIAAASARTFGIDAPTLMPTVASMPVRDRPDWPRKDASPAARMPTLSESPMT